MSSYIHHHSPMAGPIAVAAITANNTTGARPSASLHKLCRICGGEGLYNIHQRIPFFLHGCHTELDQWPATIAQMVADVGGLEYGPITVDDELPQRICSICISYLKHAVQFRQQALATVRNLKFASMLAQIDDKSAELAATECVGVTAAAAAAAAVDDFARAGESSAKFYKSNGIVAANQTTGNSTTAELRRELDQFFADELTATTASSSSSDDEDADDDSAGGGGGGGATAARQLAAAAGRQRSLRAAIHDFFNYSETPFAEDDVGALTSDRIAVRAPDDDHKERKCYACKRQFLLNTSYDEHMKACVQAKLLEFVGGCQRLVELQRDRVVSEQEFIRRMVFAVKSVVKALAMCYRGASAAEQVLGSKDVPKQMFAAKAAATASTTAVAWPKAPQMPASYAPVVEQRQNNGNVAATSAALGWPQAPFNNDMMAASMMSPAPAMPPPMHFINNPVTPMAAASAATTRPLFPKVTNFAAACLACGLRFGSIHELELHNRQLHNNHHQQQQQHHQHHHQQLHNNHHDTGSSGANSVHTSTTTPASTEDETFDAELVAMLRMQRVPSVGQRQRLVKRYGRPM